MDKEIKTVLIKSAKIAGATCFALGGAALIASGAALKALTEGARYLADTVKKIVDEEPGKSAEVVDAEAVTQESEETHAEESAVQTEEAEHTEN